MTRRQPAVLRSLLLALLASAAAPAIAFDEADGRAPRAERSERFEGRSARPAMRTQRALRMGRSIVEPSLETDGDGRSAIREQRRRAAPRQVLERASERVVEAPAARPMVEARRESVEPRSAVRRSPRFVEVEPARPTLGQSDGSDSVREWRRAERDGGRSARPALVEQRTDTGWEPLRKRPEQRIEEAAGRGERRAPAISRVPIEGSQPPAPAASSRVRTSHWRGDWRSDGRYDWRDHRRRHRSLFRFGFYYDPFGWRYRPYSIGWRLWPSYYHSRYWLHDAWLYRLPYAPPGYRWIRYYDDALLVDTWDGQVVDVIRNFFW